MLTLCFSDCEIFTVEMCMTLIVTFNTSQCQIIKWPYATFYLLAMAMFVLFVPIFEILTYEFPYALYSNHLPLK